MEHQCHHVHIITSCEVCQPLVGRQLRTSTCTQLQTHAVILFLVFFKVTIQQIIIRHPLDTVQCLVDLLYGITAHIVVVYEVGGGGDIDGGGSGIGNAKLLGEMCDFTVTLHLDAAFGF